MIPPIYLRILERAFDLHLPAPASRSTGVQLTVKYTATMIYNTFKQFSSIISNILVKILDFTYTYTWKRGQVLP